MRRMYDLYLPLRGGLFRLCPVVSSLAMRVFKSGLWLGALFFFIHF